MIRGMGKDTKISLEGAGGDAAKGPASDKKDADDKKKAEPEAAKADNAGDKAKAADDKSAKADPGEEAKAKEAKEAKEPEEPERAPEPAAPSAAPRAAGDEQEVELLDPDAIDRSVSPASPAPAPGIAPAGDARSLRRQRDGVEEFCLIYRRDSFLIRRQGKVGTAGQWSVTEYPSIGAAAHAYAQECSELTGEGFADLRG